MGRGGACGGWHRGRGGRESERASERWLTQDTTLGPRTLGKTGPECRVAWACVKSPASEVGRGKGVQAAHASAPGATRWGATAKGRPCYGLTGRATSWTRHFLSLTLPRLLVGGLPNSARHASWRPVACEVLASQVFVYSQSAPFCHARLATLSLQW